MASASDPGVMPASTASPTEGTWPARVIIIDDHEISRAAFVALLRAEGIDVTAGLKTSDQVITATRAHRPDVAIIDVTPTADTGFAIADALLALPAPPIVILTSSTGRTDFGTQLNGHRFIAKADICTAAITRLATAPEAGQPESPNPVAGHPAQAMSLFA
jgi:two-component system response regulator DesR